MRNFLYLQNLLLQDALQLLLNMHYMKRLFDFSFSFCLLIVLSPLLLFIVFAIKLSYKGPALYWTSRVGRKNCLFEMPKFRSMQIGTPEVASHLLEDPDKWLTPLGLYLRKSSLDELPQLWSILKGDMSFVGPRPALYNQDDLIAVRTCAGVHELVPGLTGWAQVNGRDELPIQEKIKLDIEYLKLRSFRFDLWILLLTLKKVLLLEGVSH